MDVLEALRKNDVKMALALVILLGLTPEEVDKLIKASRTVDLEAEEEKEEEA